MGVLEQVSQMKSQGISEQDIVSNLTQQRVSPKDINDALNQSKIKDAIYSPRTQDIQQEEYAPPQPQEEYAPQPQEEYAPQPQEQYTPPQEVYQQEGYDYSAQEGEQSSDMMIEISEQVFSEKIKKVEQQIDKMNDTQVLLKTQTEYATGSLKRIETMMDKLQVAILERIGSYGKNLESIKKEMEMIEDSFTKIIPGHKKSTHKDTHAQTSKKTSKTHKK